MIDGTLSGACSITLAPARSMISDLSIGLRLQVPQATIDVSARACTRRATLLLTNVRVDDLQHREHRGYSALGGAVWAAGLVAAHEQQITMSEAHATGFGYASGGGVYALGGLVSLYSTISNNVALVEGGTPSFGGGAFARGAATILGSTISGNQALRMGGTRVRRQHGPVDRDHQQHRLGQLRRHDRRRVRPRPAQSSTTARSRSTPRTHGPTAPATYFAAGVYITTSGNLDSTIISQQRQHGRAVRHGRLHRRERLRLERQQQRRDELLLPCPTDTSHEDPGLHPLQDNGGLTKTHVPTPGNGTHSAARTCSAFSGISAVRASRVSRRAISPRSARCRSTRTSSSRTASTEKQVRSRRRLQPRSQLRRGTGRSGARIGRGARRRLQDSPRAGAMRARSIVPLLSAVCACVEVVGQRRAGAVVEDDVAVPTGAVVTAGRMVEHAAGRLVDRTFGTWPLPGVKLDCSVIPALARRAADRLPFDRVRVPGGEQRVRDRIDVEHEALSARRRVVPRARKQETSPAASSRRRRQCTRRCCRAASTESSRCGRCRR